MVLFRPPPHAGPDRQLEPSVDSMSVKFQYDRQINQAKFGSLPFTAVRSKTKVMTPDKNCFRIP